MNVNSALCGCVIGWCLGSALASWQLAGELRLIKYDLQSLVRDQTVRPTVREQLDGELNWYDGHALPQCSAASVGQSCLPDALFEQR